MATALFSPASSLVNDKKDSGLVVGASVRSVDGQCIGVGNREESHE